MPGLCTARWVPKLSGSGIERIYVTGDYAENVVAGALDEDMDSSDIFIGTREEILEDIIGRIDAGDWDSGEGDPGEWPWKRLLKGCFAGTAIKMKPIR